MGTFGKGVSELLNHKFENILKFSSCYLKHVLIIRELLLNK